MKRKDWLTVIVPTLALALLAVFKLSPAYFGAEWGIYDLFLSIRPAVEEREEILLLDVDDLAIERVGVWPWRRSIMADGLILMSEFEVDRVTFDIEYLEESPLGVNSSVLNEEIPELVTTEFYALSQDSRDLISALQAGQIPLAEADEFVDTLEQNAEDSREKVLTKIRAIARDHDYLLGSSAAVHGRAYFTVGMRPAKDDRQDDALRRLTAETAALRPVVEEYPNHHRAADIKPAIATILEGGRGAGFPNVVVDSDGVRRRIALLYAHGDDHYGQLAFAPLWDAFGRPEMVVRKRSLVLRDAEHPELGTTDIRIPLTPEGHLLITWPPSSFEESFRHLSFYYLVLHDRQLSDLTHNLRIMDEAGYTALSDGGDQIVRGLDYAESIRREMIASQSSAEMDQFRSVREQIFELVDDFLNGGTEEELLSQIDALLSSEDVDEATKEEYRAIGEEAQELFAFTRRIYEDLMETREILARELPGSFVLIGWTGTSTTDRGVNPFSSEYDNVGTHASVYNTILQGEFLRTTSPWVGLAVAAAVAYILWFISRDASSGASIVIGVSTFVVAAGASLAIFIFNGLFLPTFAPLAAIGMTFVALTAIKYFSTAQERAFIRNAFGHYLSTDVIEELLQDESKLTLGGVKKDLTAMFTDVKGFSSISEKLDPEELVHLLNEYLSEMSEIVLDLRGTIDKYEGDAIICFFGAPVDLPDHPRRACLAAIRMKRAEIELNEHFLEHHLTPNDAEVITRIGINTGEMVVGNMGTSRKMDYTIMGNSVNLASRLEGVNKQYETWVLTTDSTKDRAGGGILWRKLDRVRVVGINQPVRLYEIVDEASEAAPGVREEIDQFEEGLSHFESRDWEKAREAFRECLRKTGEESGPAAVFARRCDKYLESPPPDNWDGVYNLSEK